MQVYEITKQKKMKMVRPVGFEPTTMGNFINKINTQKPLRSWLEVLTCGLLFEISGKVKRFFNGELLTPHWSRQH